MNLRISILSLRLLRCKIHLPRQREVFSNYTLRLKAAQRIAPQFRNDGKAAFAKLLGVRVTESTAASGGERETEEGKVTSRQEGLQPVAVCDDNFSGQKPRILIAKSAESKNISRALAG